jgi:ABC-type iron transport system FetAB permease component
LKKRGFAGINQRIEKAFYNILILLFVMTLIFDFNQNWTILLITFVLLWAILFVSRKNHGGKKEVKEQLYLAITGLFALFLMEVFATTSNLWHYFPGNWPVILWPTYGVAILFGYQLLRFIESKL